MNKLVLLSTLSLAFVMAGCSLMPSTETNTGDMAMTGTETTVAAPATETPSAEVVMTGTETPAAMMTGTEAMSTGMAQ